MDFPTAETDTVKTDNKIIAKMTDSRRRFGVLVNCHVHACFDRNNFSIFRSNLSEKGGMGSLSCSNACISLCSMAVSACFTHRICCGVIVFYLLSQLFPQYLIAALNLLIHRLYGSMEQLGDFGRLELV